MVIFHAPLVGDKPLTPGRKIIALQKWWSLTQEEIAEILGVTRGTIAAYQARDNANPSRDKLQAISRRFAIPMAWFLDYTETDPPVERDYLAAENSAAGGEVRDVARSDVSNAVRDLAAGSMIALRVWRGVAASYTDECVITEDEADLYEVPAFFTSHGDPERYRIILPVGSSMAPRIRQGDLVIIRLESNPPFGSIVVVRREDGVSYLKVFLESAEGHPEYHSINDRFPVISPCASSDEWVCRGVAVAIYKPYVNDGPNIEFNGGAPLRG